MARAFSSPLHKKLGLFLAQKRRAAGLRQIDLAKKLKRRQDYISDVETGQKILSVIELLEWEEAIGFELQEAVRFLKRK
jgi:ribosome-binding protein aMBF1 (putative translation factor)